MAKVIVYHGGYGCDTGCCAHWVQLDDPAERYPQEQSFVVEHPRAGETPIEFAKRLIGQSFAAEHVADLDWENCRVVTDDECYGF